MSVRAPILSLAASLLLAMAAAWIVAGPRHADAATSSTVVGATVPSAISLGNSCHQQAAWSLGTILPGSGLTTDTGANVCRFTWSSSNDSSMLRIHQSDRTGQAMQGVTSAWSNVWGSGSPNHIDANGSLMMGVFVWDGGDLTQSTDSGATSSVIPEAGDYTALAVASSTVAWRGGPDGVQRSVNANAATPTWTDVPAQLPDGCASVQDISTIDASTAWVLCGSDAYITTNAGVSWVQSAGDIATNPSFIEAISATTAMSVGWGTIMRTNNSNASWNAQMTGIPGGVWMAMVDSSPGTPATVWALDTGGGVYRSVDTGTSWSTLAPLPGPFEGLVVEAIDASTAIVAGDDGLAYITTDAGTSWQRLRVPNSGSILGLAALDATHMVVTGSDGATFSTADGGATWIDWIGARDDAVDLDAVDAEVFVAADANGVVDLTTDGGATWSQFQTGIGHSPVRGVAIHGSGDDDDAQVLFAVGDLGRIAVSHDGGSSWQQPASGTAQDLWDIDVRADGTALAVGDGGTILRSTDWGATWTSVGAAASRLRAVHLQADGTAIAVGDAGLVRRSTDAGATWSTRASGITDTIHDLAMPSTEVAYASGYDFLLRTADGGDTWSVITTMAGDGVSGTSRVAASSEDTVWLFQSYVGGWDTSWAARSTDGGQTWTRPFGNNRPAVTSPIALDTGTVIMAGEGGHVRMTDPAPEVANYAPGSWAGGTARFGVCLQQLGGTATAAAFVEDGDNDCQLVDGDPWNAVPAVPTKIGQVAAAGTGSVDLVWGMRADNTLAPGEYTAGVTVVAIAPNA